MSAEGGNAFAASRQRFEALCTVLDDDAAGCLEHSELEARLDSDGRELLRQLLQDHLDLRAERERRLPEVRDAGAVAHAAIEAGHQRHLTTVFGVVEVTRLAYRARGTQNLYPGDAVLNLPAERHSHGLRRLAAVEASRGSYQETVDAIARASGQQLGKRQVEALAGWAAVDFDIFYAARQPTTRASGDLLVLSCDGKGVMMRSDALREQTRRAAATSEAKLKTRLSKGEKRNRKRIAEVGAVYDAMPVPRTASDVLPANDAQRKAALAGPTAHGKWLTASVIDDAATVVCEIFAEAERRDPKHARTWVALVDGSR